MVPGQREDGQAAVELCALLPLLGVLALALWQVAVWGEATWAAGAAARAAARAEAVGGDPEAAARRVLPGRFEDGLRVVADKEGGAEIRVRVPLVAGGGQLLTVTERARFAPQGG